MTTQTPSLTSLSRLGAAVDPFAEGRDATVLAVALAQAVDCELMLLAVEPDLTIGHCTRQLLDDLQCAIAFAPRGLSGQPGYALRRVAVGFDGGTESRAALATAQRIAAGAGAQLVVRGVIDDRVPPLGWPNAFRGELQESWKEMMDEDARALRAGIDDALADLGAIADVQLERGRPAVSLLELAGDTDLLVIGSRRWGALARLVLGGTGERLVHNAPCPLLVVPRPHPDQ